MNIARERYKDMMIKNLIDLGMSGWMADFGEYVPLEARTHYPSKSWNVKDHGMVSLLSVWIINYFAEFYTLCNCVP